MSMIYPQSPYAGTGDYFGTNLRQSGTPMQTINGGVGNVLAAPTGSLGPLIGQSQPQSQYPTIPNSGTAGQSTATPDFITQLYGSIGKTPDLIDQEGRDYWTNSFADGSRTVNDFYDSANQVYGNFGNTGGGQYGSQNLQGMQNLQAMGGNSALPGMGGTGSFGINTPMPTVPGAGNSSSMPALNGSQYPLPSMSQGGVPSIPQGPNGANYPLPQLGGGAPQSLPSMSSGNPASFPGGSSSFGTPNGDTVAGGGQGMSLDLPFMSSQASGGRLSLPTAPTYSGDINAFRDNMATFRQDLSAYQGQQEADRTAASDARWATVGGMPRAQWDAQRAAAGDIPGSGGGGGAGGGGAFGDQFLANRGQNARQQRMGGQGGQMSATVMPQGAQSSSFQTQGGPSLNSYSPSPYLQQQIDGLQGQYNQNLTRNLLPAIQSQSVASGGLGGSRQGIAQAQALTDSNTGFANAASNLLGQDYQAQMGRNLQQYQGDQSYALGNKQADNSYSIGVGGLNNQRYGMDQNFAINQGQLGLGYQNSNNQYNLAVGGLNNQRYGMDLGNSINQGQLANQAQQTANNWALGAGQLGLAGQGQQQQFYGQQRGQDLQQAALGASLYGQGAAGEWTPYQNAGNIYSGFTGLGTTTNSGSAGGGAMGALGGALGAGQLASNLGLWGSGTNSMGNSVYNYGSGSGGWAGQPLGGFFYGNGGTGS